ncbi:hypothetical protein PFISCL1PPCAC_27906, partial [Pristionchus fissidentatus]
SVLILLDAAPHKTFLNETSARSRVRRATKETEAHELYIKHWQMRDRAPQSLFVLDKKDERLASVNEALARTIKDLPVKIDETVNTDNLYALSAQYHCADD